MAFGADGLLPAFVFALARAGLRDPLGLRDTLQALIRCGAAQQQHKKEQTTRRATLL
jgi:hypothetical protein